MEGLLFVVLGENATCYHLDNTYKEIMINESIFSEVDDNDFSGLYDWLRTSSTQVIGVRYTTLDNFSVPILKILENLSYVSFIHKKTAEIYFHWNESRIDDDISNDQDFGVCKILYVFKFYLSYFIRYSIFNCG